MSERVITGVATMVNPLIGGVISQAATADGFVNTQVMINMLKAAGREEDADKMQEMYDTAFNNLGSIQKSMFESKLGQKFLSGGVTIVQGNASTNPLYKDFIGGKTTTTTPTPTPTPTGGNGGGTGGLPQDEDPTSDADEFDAARQITKKPNVKAPGQEATEASKTRTADENIAAGDYSFLNKGGLATRTKKRKNKK